MKKLLCAFLSVCLFSGLLQAKVESHSKAQEFCELAKLGANIGVGLLEIGVAGGLVCMGVPFLMLLLDSPIKDKADGRKRAALYCAGVSIPFILAGKGISDIDNAINMFLKKKRKKKNHKVATALASRKT